VQQALGRAPDRSDDVWLLAPVVWHGLRAEAEASASGTEAPDPAAVESLRRVAGRIAEAAATAARPVRDTVAGYQALCEAEISRIEGRPDPAAWARAADVWERGGQPYPAAYARLRQADALYSHRTRNAEAAAALRAAYATAYRLGAQPFIREIVALAQRARVPLESPEPDRSAEIEQPAATELSTLTERELQVLAEVAAGRTNHEIADLLFISQRTVGVHVSRILHKLQVRTRVQAASVYMRSQPPGP
jgi:DNA-binding CsgD family transcriptional regulator